MLRTCAAAPAAAAVTAAAALLLLLLQALPQSVPSAVDTFTPAEAQQLQLPAAVAAAKGHAAKMEASWSSCRPDAIGGADLVAYRWAHTVSTWRQQQQQ